MTAPTCNRTCSSKPVVGQLEPDRDGKVKTAHKRKESEMRLIDKCRLEMYRDAKKV